MAKPYRRRDSRFYWGAPTIQGVQVRQSLGTTDFEEALRRLKILEGKVAGNANISPQTDRGSFGALLDLVIQHYKVNDLRSLRHVESRIDLHLKPHLGHIPTGKLSKSLISDYILQRKQQLAQHSTINRELAIIKRAFALGIEAGEVSSKPAIKMLPGERAQSGFFTEDGYRALLRHANPLLKDILVFLWHTGWRIDSVIHLEWSNVNFQRGIVGLRAEQTKNRKATAFPLEPFPELKEMLERRWKLTEALRSISSPNAARTQGAGELLTVPSMSHPRVTTNTNLPNCPKVIPWVFHRDGEPVKSINEGWLWCRKKAGLPGRKLHDFRRTAARRLLELGYPIPIIKEMIGMRTDAIFHRYCIVTEEDVLKYARNLHDPKQSSQHSS